MQGQGLSLPGMFIKDKIESIAITGRDKPCPYIVNSEIIYHGTT